MEKEKKVMMKHRNENNPLSRNWNRVFPHKLTAKAAAIPSSARAEWKNAFSMDCEPQNLLFSNTNDIDRRTMLEVGTH